MSSEYKIGIAFIMEGTTEKVFYTSFLRWLAKRNDECSFTKAEPPDIGEVMYQWNLGEAAILIKFNVVGTVTQITHSGKWFANTCVKKYEIPWHVFLCYDTDSPENNISKFYEDDWKLLREELTKAKAEKITDLAASADIEDVMLVDLEGICRYLEIPIPRELKGRKGKAKMKALFRSCGRTYHEGEKSLDMIERLDFRKIIEKGPLNLKALESSIFQPKKS